MKKKNNIKPINISVTCQTCGKPLVHTNEYGMFCEDWCELEESKKSSEFLEKLIDLFAGKEK